MDASRINSVLSKRPNLNEMESDPLVKRLLDYILNVLTEFGRCEADERQLDEHCLELGAGENFGTFILDTFDAVPAERRVGLFRPEPFDRTLRLWLHPLVRARRRALSGGRLEADDILATAFPELVLLPPLQIAHDRMMLCRSGEGSDEYSRLWHAYLAAGGDRTMRDPGIDLNNWRRHDATQKATDEAAR